jgi:predicted nucleic acid-binding protein
MIYLDASALLARIFAEDRYPADDVWRQDLVSSRLLRYEVWNRVNARGLGRSHGQDAELFLGRVDFVDLDPEKVSRAFEPFPAPVRTLDGLHLATMDFLRARAPALTLLSYDKRMLAAARAAGFAVYGA